MGKSHLFIDSLENRRLLASVTGLPIFSGKISGKAPLFVLPGQSITMSLNITNTGGDLSRTAIPIGIYVSPDTNISDAEFVEVQSPKLTIHHNKSAKASLKAFPIPTDADGGPLYVLFQIDDNTNGNAISEGDASNAVVNTPTMYNPVGEYDSTVTGDDDISVNVYANSYATKGKNLLISYASVDTDANFSSLQLDNLKTTISSTGKFSASRTYHYSYQGYSSIIGGGDAKSKAIKANYSYSYGGGGGGGKTETITITGGLKVVSGQIELIGSVNASVNIIGDRADSGKTSFRFTAPMD